MNTTVDNHDTSTTIAERVATLDLYERGKSLYLDWFLLMKEIYFDHESCKTLYAKLSVLERAFATLYNNLENCRSLLCCQSLERPALHHQLDAERTISRQPCLWTNLTSLHQLFDGLLQQSSGKEPDFEQCLNKMLVFLEESKYRHRGDLKRQLCVNLCQEGEDESSSAEEQDCDSSGYSRMSEDEE